MPGDPAALCERGVVIMRIYISGAVTGTDDAEERFSKWEDFLKEAGHDVVNPFKVCSSISDWSHKSLMGICFRLMDECSAAVFMPEWKGSLGANQEYGYAVGKDMIIFEPKDFDDLISMCNTCNSVTLEK